MIRDRTYQKAAAPLILALGLLVPAGLSSRVGLADDDSKSRGINAEVAGGESSKVGGDARPAKGADAAPRPPDRPPGGKSATSRPTPTRKGTSSKKAAPGARNAPPPGDENPELDREILQALGRGPSGGPGFQTFVQGSMTLNGQTQQFRGQPVFPNAFRQGNGPGFPAPGMPRNGQGMPGMPFTQFQGNFLAPALGGMRTAPRRATAAPKRRTATAGKAAANPAAPREKAMPGPDPVPAPGRPG